MKAIKNKKRFDPRQFLDERREEAKENVEKTNANFNSFSLDNWLEEGSVKEMQAGDGVGPEYPDREVPPAIKSRRTAPQKSVKNPLKGYEEGTGQARVGRDGKPVEEACGDPEMGPEEAEPAVTDLSPDEAFGAGYTSAVEEIMASLEGLLGAPMDMGIAPEDEEESALVVAQIQEGEVRGYGPDDPTYLIDIDPKVDRVKRREEKKAEKEALLAAAEIEDHPYEKKALRRRARNIEYDTVFWGKVTSKNVNTIADWYNKFSDLGYTDIPPNSEIIVKKEVDGEWVDVNDIFDEPGYVEDDDAHTADAQDLTFAGAKKKYIKDYGLEES